MYKSYAGIGSRKTPAEILVELEKIATNLAEKKYTLRSGGADGADSAFEQGCNKVSGEKEIYLPWKEFNKNASDLYLSWNIDKKFYDIIRQVNHTIFLQSHASLVLHARNCQQILGQDLNSPCDFVVCWTDRDKFPVTGTMFAITLAKINHIPVINLYEKNWKNKLDSILFKAENGGN